MDFLKTIGPGSEKVILENFFHFPALYFSKRYPNPGVLIKWGRAGFGYTPTFISHFEAFSICSLTSILFDEVSRFHFARVGSRLLAKWYPYRHEAGF